MQTPQHIDVVVSLLINSSLGHLSLITLLHLIAYGYCLTLRNAWVSDDIEGIAKFSDHFKIYKDEAGKFVKEEKVDSYSHDLGGGKTAKVKHTAWNPYLPFPDNFMRWFRLNWGKTFKKIGENNVGHEVYGYVQNSQKHHLLSLIVQLGNLILGYFFLSHLFGAKLALLATLLFAVYPLGVQTVAWISGVNYALSLLGALATFNIAIATDNPHIFIPAIIFTSALSCFTLLPGCLNWIILLMLGQYNEAIVAAVIGTVVMLKIGRGTVKLRVDAFKEQSMGQSTGFKLSKAIVMVKTFGYYVKLILFPKRLGLFHTFGYHYEEPIEHIDRNFWFGALSISVLTFAAWVSPGPIQFGLAWAFIYLLFFSNIITAQQFVSERYGYISTFGVSIVLAYLLQSHIAIFTLIIGIFLMRIWTHLPTFQNEVRFYESNVTNFPTSEVAMGNLGVAYLNHGMHYKAFDTWNEATRQNPFYDVPWYNLYSIAKQNGDIINARNFLQRCLASKTVHYKDQWQKELNEIDAVIVKAISDGKIQQVPK